MRNTTPPAVGADGRPARGDHHGDYCPLTGRPLLRHPLHWPFRTWANVLLRRPVELLAVATCALLGIGSTLLFWVERGQQDGGAAPGMITIRSWWDALWLCVTSASTDSYGDVAPHTALGRVVSITIAFLGIILVGSFTAAITSYIVREPTPPDPRLDELCQRLARIEALLVQGAGQQVNGP
jgi:hypothetical protein